MGGREPRPHSSSAVVVVVRLSGRELGVSEGRWRDEVRGGGVADWERGNIGGRVVER